MPSGSWFPPQRPEGRSLVQLFCLPWAGGGASAYRAWTRTMPEEIEVCPVQLPGREERWSEPPFRRAEPCIEALTVAIASRLERPYALFGHSMGALLAFELARSLRRRGLRPPVRLFVAAHRAPSVPARRPPASTGSHGELVAELRRLGGTSEEVLSHPEMMRLVLPLYRADTALCEGWRPASEPRLDVSITAFGGESDPEVTPADLAAWREETGSEFRLHLFPGGHFFLHDAGGELTRRLAAELLPVAVEAGTRTPP